MRARGKGRPPWKNHGFTRQIAYAYKAVLFRALTHRRVYLTDIPIRPRCILCGVLYLLAADGIAVENEPARDFLTEDTDIVSIINFARGSIYLFRSFQVVLIARRNVVDPGSLVIVVRDNADTRRDNTESDIVRMERVLLVVIIDVIRSTFFAPFPFPQPRLFLSRV